MKLIKWNGGLTYDDTKILDLPEVRENQESIESIDAYHYWNKSKNLYRITYLFPNGERKVKEYKYNAYFI